MTLRLSLFQELEGCLVEDRRLRLMREVEKDLKPPALSQFGNVRDRNSRRTVTFPGFSWRPSRRLQA
jgi:hypothetical protein